MKCRLISKNRRKQIHVKQLYKLEEESWAEVTWEKDYKERKETLENIASTIESLLNESQQMKKKVRIL